MGAVVQGDWDDALSVLIGCLGNTLDWQAKIDAELIRAIRDVKRGRIEQANRSLLAATFLIPDSQIEIALLRYAHLKQNVDLQIAAHKMLLFVQLNGLNPPPDPYPFLQTWP